MNTGQTLAALRRREKMFASELDAVADRHVADADVFHHAHLMADVAREHAALLTPFVRHHGRGVSARPWRARLDDAVAALRRAASHMASRHEAAGALLLRDLRRLLRTAGEVEIDWWIARQGALVTRDEALVALFERCHEETWNHYRWLKTKIKEAAPQVLAG